MAAKADEPFSDIVTPLGLRTIRDSDEFSGFRDEFDNVSKIRKIEREMREVMEALLNTQETLTKQNKILSDRRDEYERKIKEMGGKVEESKSEMKEAKMEVKGVWKEERRREEVSFREVMEKQLEQKAKNTVISVIRQNENLVRDSVERKKSVIIFGVKEKKNPIRQVREKEQKDLVNEIVAVVGDREEEIGKEIEVVHRIGKYKEGASRPIKVIMKTQTAVDHIIRRTGKLAEKEDFKNIWIKRDMSEDERMKERELRKDANEKNEKRTENEKKTFYWRVLDMGLRKWYIKRQGQRERI